MVADRAGEGALLVAEELALQHALAERPAVDGHELPPPAAHGVQRAGRDLLAGARLPQEQDRGLVGRDGRERAAEADRAVAPADDVRRAILVGIGGAIGADEEGVAGPDHRAGLQPAGLRQQPTVQPRAVAAPRVLHVPALPALDEVDVLPRHARVVQGAGPEGVAPATQRDPALQGQVLGGAQAVGGEGQEDRGPGAAVPLDGADPVERGGDGGGDAHGRVRSGHRFSPLRSRSTKNRGAVTAGLSSGRCSGRRRSRAWPGAGARARTRDRAGSRSTARAPARRPPTCRLRPAPRRATRWDRPRRG